MPLFTVFGTLSDRIGRKGIMMAGCLIAVLSYIPIYKAMEHYAGNNVVDVVSARNKVTGAISLTPRTTDATGAFVAAKEASSPNIPMLVLLVLIQVVYVCMVYGPIAAYLVEAFPAKIRYTIVVLRCHRQYLCRTVLSNDRGGHDLCRRQPASEGDAWHQDLGRGRGHEIAEFRRLTRAPAQ